MKKVLLIVAYFAILWVAGCNSTYRFGVHIGTDGIGTSRFDGSGLQLMLSDGGPRLIPEGSTLDFPIEYGNIPVLYEASSSLKKNIDRVEWRIDGQFAWSTGVQQTYTMGNDGCGTRMVQAVIFRRWAGDNRGAPGDTLSFYTHTYFGLETSGLRRVEKNPDMYILVSPRSTIPLPNSYGNLTMTFRPSWEMTIGRSVVQVDWYRDHQFMRHTAAGECVTYYNTVDGYHEAMALVYYLKAGTRAVAGVDTLRFNIDMSVDIYPR